MAVISSSVKPAWESAVVHAGGKPTSLEKNQYLYKGDDGEDLLVCELNEVDRPKDVIKKQGRRRSR